MLEIIQVVAQKPKSPFSLYRWEQVVQYKQHVALTWSFQNQWKFETKLAY